MSKICQVTQRKAGKGYKYVVRGIPKKKKGIGLKVTGKTRRRFELNLVTKRFWFPEENRFVSLRLSTRAIRTIDKLGINTVIQQMRREGQHV